MIHAAESCEFLETFGDKLTMPVRTRSRLKHVLLENKFGKNFMEYKPFVVENVEFQYKGDMDNNTNSNSTNSNSTPGLRYKIPAFSDPDPGRF